MSTHRRPSPHRSSSSGLGRGINLPPSRHASRSPSPISSMYNEKHHHHSHHGALRERTTLGRIRIFTQRYRIFLLLGLFLIIIVFSHYSLSPGSSSGRRGSSNPTDVGGGHHVYDSSHLKAINYLNHSHLSPSSSITSRTRTFINADGEPETEIISDVSYSDAYTNTPPNPFSFCPIYGNGDDLAGKYGTHVLTQSRIHVGSGDRVIRVLNRAMQGLPVTISVIGGSVSACHGSGDDPLSPTCYPSLFFSWWNSIFPHPFTSLTNGAMRRTNSGYYAFCSSHHLPDSSDLIIIELDSEDVASNSEESLDHYEVLVRSLLLRPDRPAVVLLGHYSPQMGIEGGYVGSDHWHNVVAQFYDVPYVSIKSVLWNQIMGRSSPLTNSNQKGKGGKKKEVMPKGLDAVSKKYFVDPVLPNREGQGLLADILVHYFQQMTCEAWDEATREEAYPFNGIYGGSNRPAGNGKKNGGGGEKKEKKKDLIKDEEKDANGKPKGGLFGGAGKPKGVPEPTTEDGTTTPESGGRLGDLDDVDLDLATGKEASDSKHPSSPSSSDEDEDDEEGGASESTNEDLPPDADSDSSHRPNLNLLLSHPSVQKLLNPVPPARINARPHSSSSSSSSSSSEEIHPFCVSANDLVNPLPPSIFYGSGWSEFHAGRSRVDLEKGVGIEPDGEGGPMRITSHYWFSTLPTSKVRVPIKVGSGDVGVYYMREPLRSLGSNGSKGSKGAKGKGGKGKGKGGKEEKEEGSAIECWVDDNYSGAKLIENGDPEMGEGGEGRPTLAIIDRHVARGSHFVECVLLGEEGTTVKAFKILGVFAT